MKNYFDSRRHKRIMREKCAKKYYNSISYQSLLNEHDGDERAIEYWKEYYISGSRKIAKSRTNERARNESRKICHDAIQAGVGSDNLEDAIALNNSEYRKLEDYDYTVW